MSSSRPSSSCQGATRALLSIKSKYAEAILRGEKKYEFRRIIFSRHVDVVLLYVSSPVKQVVAEFDVAGIFTEPLPGLWQRTKRLAGIDESSFYDYFRGVEHGHAIAIGDVRPYDVPFCPVQQLGLRPPQSFVYVNARDESNWISGKLIDIMPMK